VTGALLLDPRTNQNGDWLADFMEHHEWAKNLAHKFGNAAVYGAGATFGSDLVNDAMRKF
tara:strand:- start:22764 stop:22943 length:180 start_codon:yes stop_codon:yes gene_type:complete